MNDEFTYKVIGLAMEVHRELGPGLDEKFYHDLLSRKLVVAGLAHLSRPRRELMHCGLVADIFEPDIVFPERLVLELKCLTGGFEGENFLQLICYLKFWKIKVGLLFDFGKESLAHRRIEFTEPVFAPPDPEALLAGLPAAAGRATALRIGEATRNVLATHGLGYRDTTYGGLLTAELRGAGSRCQSNVVTDVQSGDVMLGQTTCPCLLVDELIAVRVLALRQSITAAEIATLRTYLRLLNVPCGLILNFNRTSLDVSWVSHQKQKSSS